MKKLVIFDMDGTIYLGKDLIDGAKECFNYLKDNNIDYVFFTNNSSHSLESYYEKITNFDIPSSFERNYYSSTEVTINYLKEKGVKKLFVIGNKFFREKLSDFELVPTYDKNIKVDAVLIAFSTELVYDELRSAALYLETQDPLYIATNLDYRCPIEDGLYIPDCGGMAEWLYLTTGKRPIVMGKPNTEMIHFLKKKFDVTDDEVLVIGDRIYTDILVGVNANVTSVMVLSGETKLEELKNYDYSPTYIIDSIKDLPKLIIDLK